MTISSTTRIAGPFIGNGTASAFGFTFKVFTAGDIDVVRLNTSTGVETTLVLTTDYTVALNIDQDSNPGGTVTLVAGPLATGFTLTITSDIANLQPTDLTNQGGFYPEVITDSFDRATIQIQQMAGEVSRSIKVPLSDSTFDMELPGALARANSFVAFDGNGALTTQAASSSAAPTSITRQVFSGTGSQTIFALGSDPGGAGNSAQVFIGGVYQQRNTYTISGSTLTFSQAPVAGTNNIEFVNFLIGSGSNGVGIVTLTGDVTGSGTGTVPATVAANAVTFAKMQQIATDRLLGRDSLLTGDVEQLTVGGGVEFTGSGGIQTSAFTGNVTKSAGGTALTIANAVVAPAMLTTGGPSWTSGGDVTVTGDLTVTGNDIKSSTATAITMSGADVAMQGNTTFKNVTEGVVAIGTVGAAHTFDLTNGTLQTATLTSATAATFTMPTATAGKRFQLLIKQPASGSTTTATFTGVKWPAGTGPTITATLGRLDIINFVADGTNWYGTFSQNFTP
jgi:hypothetical protein